MNPSSPDFDRAICIYLGGNPNDSSIQIGMGAERLTEAFGADASRISRKLDEFFRAILKCAPIGFSPNGLSLYRWLALEFPSLSESCLQKVESYVWYNVTH